MGNNNSNKDHSNSKDKGQRSLCCGCWGVGLLVVETILLG
jgi:hypothetical protein